MSEWTYVGAAYSLTWVTLAAYWLYVRGRVRRAASELRNAEVAR